MTYILTYVPRGVNAARPEEIATKEVQALHARHAAQQAQAFERRSGNRVLTVKEKGK